MRLFYTDDGSISAYNDVFDDYYHDKKGALLESIYKHIIPAFSIKSSGNIKILDICFGLGYNSLLSLAFAKKFNIKVDVYSVEIDLALLHFLYDFQYPKILSSYLDINKIINCINNDMCFMDSNITLNVFRGDALEFINTLDDNFFDIIYQDAFSPSKNKSLWSMEYFLSLHRILNHNGIITTYSSSNNIRNIVHLCGFDVFNMKFAIFKNGSLFTKNINKINNLDSIEFSYIRL